MSEQTTITPIFEISDKAYDVLSAAVRYVLPGLATLYLGLAGFWILPNPTEIAGTITLVTTFLGIFLSISKRRYIALNPTPSTNESVGDILLDLNEEGNQALTVALEKPLDELNLQDKDHVVLKVVRTGAENSTPGV